MRLRGGEETEASNPEIPAAPLVRPAALLHVWEDLSFIHWPYDPEAVQRLLPAGLVADTFEGAAWVGIVPFHVTITPPMIPALPWVSHFEEMNVRTYVRDASGSSGVWFISLDAARLGAVGVARSTYRLPYTWAKMTFTKVDDLAVYRCARRGRGARPSCDLVVRVGPRISPRDMTPLDHFLTTRWRFYCHLRRGLAEAFVDHEPWPLRSARVVRSTEDLVSATGLPEPAGDPVVHFSERVDVRMGFPKVVVPQKKNRRGCNPAPVVCRP